MAQKLFSQDEKYLTKGANEALTAYRFVKHATDTADVDMCDTAGELAIGVTDAAWSSGDEACRIVFEGVTYVQAGAAVAVDAPVQTDANGKGITALSADYVLGRALSAAAADGDLIAILLNPHVNIKA
jgi:hypothetical protein